jgi:hypothetical protein
MVHALKHAHRILGPDGLLINVHGLPVPYLIEVHSAGTAVKAGWLMDSTDFEAERLAFNALARVVSEGHFLLEDERGFSYNMHMDDVHELQGWLAEDWETAVLPEKTIQRVESIFREVDQAGKVVLNVPTRMTRLRVR